MRSRSRDNPKDNTLSETSIQSARRNGAMNPARLTKPDEYKVWKSFYEDTFAPTNKAIMAKDAKAFDVAYTSVIKDCNGCHAAMGYGFIKVVKQAAPSDQGIDYKIKSEPGDVPK